MFDLFRPIWITGLGPKEYGLHKLSKPRKN